MHLKRFSKHFFNYLLTHPSKIDPAYPTVPQKAFKSAENLQIYQKSAYIGFLVKPRWFIRFAHITTHFKVLFNAFEKIFKTFFQLFCGAPLQNRPSIPNIPQKAFKSAENLQIYQKSAYIGFQVKPMQFIRIAHITTHFKVLFNALEKIFKTFFQLFCGGPLQNRPSIPNSTPKSLQKC